MPTSCQLRVVQYARTISHDSPAPHSYHPTMGRRQRRQPINPPPPSGLEACQTQAEDPQSSSAEFCNPLMKSEFRPPAALAGPPSFHSRSGPPFASIPCILRCFVPRRCSEFEFWTPRSPDPRNIMQIMLSGSSEFEIWTPPDPNPRYIMQIMLSGSSEFEFWTPLGPSFFVFFFPTIDQFD